MKQNKCVFCRIAENINPAAERILFDKQAYFIMLSLHPQTRGHTILIPKKHFSDLKQIPSKLQGWLFQEVVKMAESLKNALQAKAYLIKVNNALYQLEKDHTLHVGHIHFHIIPRYKAEEKLPEQPKKATKKELLAIKEQIMKDIGTIK